MINENFSTMLILTLICFIGRREPFSFTHSRTRRGGRRGRPPPRTWKISGQTLFSGHALVAQKSWMIENISIQWKIPGQLCFSGQVQVAQKSWMIKNTYSIQSKIRGQLSFRACASCSKILHVKNIFHTVKVFKASVVAQKSWMVKNIFNTVKDFRGNSVFRASASC